MPYVIQSVFILLGPIFFAATIYMILGRVVTRTDGGSHSIVGPRWLTAIFVGCDCFAFLIQGSGAGLLVKSDNQSMGKSLIVAGLIFQVAAFGVFIITGAVFYRRMSAMPTRAALEFPYWTTILRSLFILSCLILIRNIFRIAEYAMGTDGYLLSHEWATYVFDALLMFTAMMVFAIWHPGQIRQKADRVGEVKELSSFRKHESSGSV